MSGGVERGEGIVRPQAELVREACKGFPWVFFICSVNSLFENFVRKDLLCGKPAGNETCTDPDSLNTFLRVLLLLLVRHVIRLFDRLRPNIEQPNDVVMLLVGLLELSNILLLFLILYPPLHYPSNPITAQF